MKRFRSLCMSALFATSAGLSLPAWSEASTTVAKSIPVSSAPPTVRDIEYVLTALGSVESLNSPTISAETAGRITSVEVEVGSRTELGQLLVTIDNSLYEIQVAEAEAEYKRQRVMLENQRREVERQGRLASTQSVSKNQLEDQQDQLAVLEAQQEVTRKRLEHVRHLESMTRVVAPQVGAIAHRHVSPGDYVSPGQPLFDLVTVDRLRARLAFPEQDASSIEIGQEVYLNTPAAPRVLAIGAVTQISPRISRTNRAVEVLVEFNNPGGWFPGGSVNATLIFARNPNALTVPRLSVVQRGGSDVVFVVSNGVAQARQVVLGWQEPEWVEITKGLDESEQIVVEGAALLSDGSSLQLTGNTP